MQSRPILLLMLTPLLLSVAEGAELPDLVIQDITWIPQVPKTGESVQFIFTVKNQGTLSAADAFLSASVDGERIGGGTPAVDLTSPLAPGATTTKTYTWTVGTSVSGGSHVIKAITDAGYQNNRVVESDETNNEKEATFQVNRLQPDLVVESITWMPQVPKTGESVQFIFMVKNLGALSAADAFLSAFVDGEMIGGNTPAVDLFSPLAPGTTTTKTYTWKIGTSVPRGTHVVRAVADAGYQNNRVVESDETNNVKEVTFQVDRLQPDLSVDSITWTPLNPKVGDSVLFTIVVRNQGTLSATDAFLSVFVDREQLCGNTPGVGLSPPLSAGVSASMTCTWKVGPSVADGDHKVRAVIDAGYQNNRVEESDETNNAREDTFPVGTTPTPTPTPPPTLTPSCPAPTPLPCAGGTVREIYGQVGGLQCKVGFECVCPSGWRSVPGGCSPWRDPPLVSLTSTKSVAPVGQEALLALSIINPSVNDYDMVADLVIQVPSGVTVHSSSFAAGGSNAYIATFTVKPGPQPKYETLQVSATEPGEKIIHGIATYYPAGKKDAFEKAELNVSLRFNPTPTPPPTQPAFELPLVLAALAGVYLLRYRRNFV